ncbi:MAG: helix-turn-helix domain-containing protein [Spirosomataceae bacterium]
MATFFSQNLTFLRSQLPTKMSQEKLAEELGIKKSTWSTYEVGRAEPRYDDLVRIADYFGVSMDALLTCDLAKEPFQLSSHSLQVLVTAVNDENEERIVHIPIKAAAGYAKGYGDLEFISNLQTYHLPFLPRDRTYRSHEIQGDSMLPLREGSIVLCEFVEDWRNVKDGTICLIVTQNEGLLLKKVFNYLKERKSLLLTSTNERYRPIIQPIEEIKEIWKFVGYFSQEFPQNG